MFLFFILFYRLSDKVLMKTYSLCGLCGDKKAFKEKKICGAIASKWILFIWSFFLLSQKLNILSSISFYITNHRTIKFLETFWNLDNKFAPLKGISRVAVLLSKPLAIQFSYKFEFILCENWGTFYKDIEILNW